MENIREVYSLLVPLENGRIILPRAAVAEVVGFAKPKDRPDDAPAFLLGYIHWQKQRIPLVSFEAACGKPVPEMGRRARIAIIFGIEGKLGEPNVYALVTQGYPYLVRVNEGVLKLEEMEEGDESGPVLCRARMANERPKIPDIGKLELMLAEALGITDEDVTGSDAAPAVEEVDELEALAGDEEDAEDGFLAELDSIRVDDDELGEPDDDEEYDLDSISFETDDDDSIEDSTDDELEDFLKDED